MHNRHRGREIIQKAASMISDEVLASDLKCLLECYLKEFSNNHPRGGRPPTRQMSLIAYAYYKLDEIKDEVISRRDKEIFLPNAQFDDIRDYRVDNFQMWSPIDKKEMKIKDEKTSAINGYLKLFNRSKYSRETAFVLKEIEPLEFNEVKFTFRVKAEILEKNLNKKTGDTFSLPLFENYIPHSHPMETKNFTGRKDNRKSLDDWLREPNKPMLLLTAMGGMGKSSLAWYWLNNDVRGGPHSLDSLAAVLRWSPYS